LRKTGLALLLVLVLVLPGAVASAPQLQQRQAPVPVLASIPALVQRVPVVLLIDLGAGQVLYSREAERRFLPASMTKAMSALVAFDLIAGGKLREDQRFVVDEATARQWSGKGTSLFLAAGTEITVADLLHGMTTVSANDATVVLAKGALGSTEAWTAQMNVQAQRLGMKNSHFATPNGWPDRGATFVSAQDLVHLAEALIYRHPKLYHRYFGQTAMDWHGRKLTSHDPFAGVVPGADGIKTGHTFEAGFNFLGSVERDGRRLVLVIAGAQNEDLRAKASRELVEWGYSVWDSRILAGEGARIGTAQVQGGNARTVPLIAPRRFTVAVPKGSSPTITTRIIYHGPLRAPIAKGTLVAELQVEIAGQSPNRLPLSAATSVGKARPLDRLINGLAGLVS
jgi:serine-type D-Ala-D-Ala carboxypeptidase (penicillin-binding protein 5/6)